MVGGGVGGGAGYFGVLVSDPWLQNQFTQVELRGLKAHVRVLILVYQLCLEFES